MLCVYPLRKIRNDVFLDVRSVGRHYDPQVNVMNVANIHRIFYAFYFRHPSYAFVDIENIGNDSGVFSFGLSVGNAFCEGNMRINVTALRTVDKLRGWQYLNLGRFSRFSGQKVGYLDLGRNFSRFYGNFMSPPHLFHEFVVCDDLFDGNSRIRKIGEGSFFRIRMQNGSSLLVTKNRRIG